MKGGEQTMAEKEPLPWGSKVLIGVLVVILVPVALAIAALVMFVVTLRHGIPGRRYLCRRRRPEDRGRR